jgi:hypothetical protein
MNEILQIEKEMIQLVNDERAKLNLSRLESSSALCSIARDHSKVQLRHKEIFHKSPVDDTEVGDRLKNNKYLYASCGENVSTAPTLMISHKGLMNSPGHYKNIVGEWKEIGIGIERDYDGQLYVTQIFANPVKRINPLNEKVKILDKVHRYRKTRNIQAIHYYELESLQKHAEQGIKKNLDTVLDNALNEFIEKKVHLKQAFIYSFSGAGNAGSEKQLEHLNNKMINGLSIGLHQNAETGMLNGIFLFTETYA